MKMRNVILVLGAAWLVAATASSASAQWGWRGHMARRHAMWTDMMRQHAAAYGVPGPTRVEVSPGDGVVETPQVTVRWGWGPGGVSYSWGVAARPAFDPQLDKYQDDPAAAEQTVQRPPLVLAPPAGTDASVLRPPVIEAPPLTPPGPPSANSEDLPPPRGPIEF